MDPWSDQVIWIVVVAFILSFLLAFGVGANDVANNFGTSVGSGAISIRLACILATIFEIAGAVLIGYKVSETMRKGIIDVTRYEGTEKVLMLGSLSALGGSALWNLLATFLCLPISGTHTIVGATIGFSLVARGTQGVNWMTFAKIVGSWFVSPVLSGVISVCIFLLVRRLVLRSDNPLCTGLKVLPFFYGFTILVNLFSVLHDGPKLLYMDNLPLWVVLLVSAGVAFVVAVLIQLLLVPRLRNNGESKECPNAELPMKLQHRKELAVTQTTITTNGAASDNGTNKNGHILSEHDQKSLSPVNCDRKQQQQKEQQNEEKMDKMEKEEKVEESGESATMFRLFAALQVMTATFGSFAHGGNDVSNAIGPLIAVWLIFKEGSVVQQSETPILILLYGGVGISVGLWVLGRRVIKTIGEDLTHLTTSSGFTIELGAAFTVLVASKVGLPISTTHCKVGSVVFVGWAQSTSDGVDWKIFRNIVIAWLVTVPFAAGASAAIMALLLQVAV